MNEKQAVRNARGSLLCELYYDGRNWSIDIKKGNYYTALILYPGGSFHVANESGASETHAVVELE